MATARSVTIILGLIASLSEGCFVGRRSLRAPSPSTSPEDYNQLPQASPSLYAIKQPLGTQLQSCGHSKFFNVGTGYEAFLRYNNAGIVNGVAAVTNEFPYHVYIILNTGSSCGAAVINSWWLITAAHCLENAIWAVATFGNHYLSKLDDGEFDIGANTLVLHPLHKSSSTDYDFGLVKLDSPINFTTWNVQPICLPDSCFTACKEGDMGYLAGWGLDSTTGAQPDVLMKVKLPVVLPINCALSELAGSPVTNRMLCAGYDTTSAAPCFGDSGGALAIAKHGYFELCGLVSYSRSGCATDGTYAVYSRVCAVRSWIKEVAGI